MTIDTLTQPAHQVTGKLPVQFVFDELHRAGIRYALLRGFDELFHGSGDLEIDLLVHPDDVAKLNNCLASKGFVETPAWGHAPHRFLLAFRHDFGHWLKLDLVTDLRYGRPIRKYQVDLREQCLEGRRFDRIYQLSQGHEFLTLLLHCLLDKGKFDDKHRKQLCFLLQTIQRDQLSADVLRELVVSHLHPAVDWELIVKTIETDDWEQLLKKEQAMRRQFGRKSPVGNLTRSWQARFMLRMRPVFFSLFRRGVSVVLLAPDGAGKSTLAGSLVRDKKLRARLIYMGTNPEARTVGLPLVTTMNDLEKRIRKQERHTTVAGRLVRAANFVLTLLDHWYRCLVAKYNLVRGRFVVFDRFVYDAWIQKRNKTPWKRLRRFLYDAPCPTPDLVILLDAPGVLFFERKGEHSVAWIEQQRAGYHQLKELLPQMRVVDASRTADQVRAEVIALIWQTYDRKSRGSGS